MYEINRTVVAGRLTKDPEIRYTQGESPLCIATFKTAVNRPSKTGTADFVDCKVFGKSAEFVEQHLRKGSPVMVEGHVEATKFTKRDGTSGRRFEVVSERLTSEKEGNLNFNSVILCGHLTMDPELKGTDGNPVTKFSIAVKRRPKKGEQESSEEPYYIRCTAFGNAAVTAAKYLSKGKGVLVSGRILTGSSYVNQNGATVYPEPEVVAEDIRFTHSKKSEDARNANAASENVPEPTASQAAIPQEAAPKADEPVSEPAEAGNGGLFDGLDGFMEIPEDGYDELPFN